MLSFFGFGGADGPMSEGIRTAFVGDGRDRLKPARASVTGVIGGACGPVADAETDTDGRGRGRADVGGGTDKGGGAGRVEEAGRADTSTARSSDGGGTDVTGDEADGRGGKGVDEDNG